MPRDEPAAGHLYYGQVRLDRIGGKDFNIEVRFSSDEVFMRQEAV